MIYSIIETSRANNLKPFEYMTYLLEMLPNVDVKDQNKNPSYVKEEPEKILE